MQINTGDGEMYNLRARGELGENPRNAKLIKG